MILAFSSYLLLHFALYATALRHGKALASETRILLYHFAPAVLWMAVLAVLALLGAVPLGLVVLLGGIHGIYSLTFLELWALSDGGYSLAIMECLDCRKDVDEEIVLDHLFALGVAKNRPG